MPSPLSSPPGELTAERAAMFQHASGIAQTLNRAEAALGKGRVIEAQAELVELRGQFVEWCRALGLA